MADPKIKYDIEAAVKGSADADQLARALRNVSDLLEGDLKDGALQSAQALEALASKQRAIDTFSALKRETVDLGAALEKATQQVNRLGSELPQTAANTQALAAAERSADAALEQARAALQSKRDALRAVREETQGSARRSDEYKATVAGLKDAIKAATAEVRAKQDALRASAQSSAQAQNAEAALRKEYELAIGSSARLSAELGNKRRALAETREIMQAVGISTDNLSQSEAALRAAVAQARQEVVALVPAYQQAAAASTQSTQVQAQNQRTLREGMTSISTQLANIQQIATVALGGSYVGGLAKSVADTADQFRNLEARIKLVTGEGPLFQAAFTGVQQVALRTNSALDETGTLFTRLAKAGQEAGLGAQQAQANALALTETINQAIQLSGGSAESSRAAITQLIQGLQSGVLRGEEFNSVMEQAPRLAEAMAKGLGVTTGELRTLAGQGALTAETVMRALRGQADVVANEFSKLPPTVGRALQNLSTQWTLYVGQADNGLISSANAAKVINALANNLDTLVNTLAAAGKLWAAIKIAGLAADFGAWATSTLAATAAVEKNTLAMAANTAAQAGNTAAQAANTAAQAANTVATNASTAARSANAASWAAIATFAGQATVATNAATAATTAGAAAAGAKAASLGVLGTAIRGVTGLLGGPVGLIATVVLFGAEIKRGVAGLGEWVAGLTDAGQKLKKFEEQQKRESEEAKRAAEAKKAQAAAQQLLADKTEEARSRSFDLTNQSKGLIAEFDKMRASGQSAGDAIGKIGKDFDLASVPGIRSATAVLDKLLADGKLTAGEFQAAWAQALAGKDLAQFEVMARAAFAAAAQDAEKLRQQLQQAIANGASEQEVKALEERLRGAMTAAGRESERVGQMMDNVLREAVKRTGLEFAQLEGRIGAAARSALNDVDVIVRGMDKLQAQGVDVGRVLSASFSKAIETADSQQAIDELRERIEGLRTVAGSTTGDAIAGGLLDQLEAKALQVRSALDQATPGINSVAEAMERLGVTSDASLKRTASEAQKAYDAMAQSGKASARELAQGFERAAQAAIAANNGIAPAWVQAQALVRGFVIETDAAGRQVVKSMAEAEEATNRVGRAAGGAAGGFGAMGRAAADAAENIQRLRNAERNGEFSGSGPGGQFQSEAGKELAAKAKEAAQRGQMLESANLLRRAAAEDSLAQNAQKSRDTRFVGMLDSDINQMIAQRYGDDMVDNATARAAIQRRMELDNYRKSYGDVRRSQESLNQQRNIAAELDRLERLIEEERAKRSGSTSASAGSLPERPQRGGGSTTVNLHYNNQSLGQVTTDAAGRAALERFMAALSDGKSASR